MASTIYHSHDLVKMKLIEISPGSYPAGGVNSKIHTVTVNQKFYTPPGEVTNLQAQAVTAKYGDRPNGIFVKDKLTGHHYLYAIGKGDDAKSFEPLDSKFFPIQLGVPNRIEDLLNPKQNHPRLELDPKNVRQIMPREGRYKEIRYKTAFAAPEAAITHINGWQAQALAQLMSDHEIAEALFGIGGNYYSDLLTNKQWGLMAMEGILEFMSSTGTLGLHLRAHDLRFIVRATDYPPLPNGVLPNTVCNWVKNSVDKDLELAQILRGDSFEYRGLIGKYSAFRDDTRFASKEYRDAGFRVGYFPIS